MSQVICKVVLLETKKISKITNCNLSDANLKGLYITTIEYESNFDKIHTNYHLYITNDEDIKSGEYGIDHMNFLVKVTRDLVKNSVGGHGILKIISTSDKDLGLPLLDEYFIEEYVNLFNLDKKITEVLVDVDEHFKPNLSSSNKVSIQFIKNNWTQEEVITMCEKFAAYCIAKRDLGKENCYSMDEDWKLKNLSL